MSINNNALLMNKQHPNLDHVMYCILADTASDSTKNPPNSVNNAQDFMSIKFMSLLRNKLHPNRH